MTLEVARFRGEPGPKPVQGAHTAILVRYGEQHEAEVLRRLEDEGRHIVRIDTGPSQDELRAAIAQTARAMRDGAEVIHQAALVGGSVGGYADFLERVERASALGEWSYEPADAKLARVTKPYFLVQLSAYGLLLDELQGSAPEELAVLLGDGTRDPYRAGDFAAYVRRLEGRALGLAEAGPGETYPLPCAHCPICGYRHACEGRREQDDHLSLVAGLARDQARKLEEAGVTTLTALAELPEERRVPQLARQTLDTLRRQATLQLSERRTGRPRYELLDTEAGRGLGAAARAAERRPLLRHRGRPVLGGARARVPAWRRLARHGEERFTAFWAHDRDEERRAFERVIDLIRERRAAHPASARLPLRGLRGAPRSSGSRCEYGDARGGAGRPAPRRRVFVDLYKVVRQGLAHLASRATGSSRSRRSTSSARPTCRRAATRSSLYEDWLSDRDPAVLDEIAAYNEEDCALDPRPARLAAASCAPSGRRRRTRSPRRRDPRAADERGARAADDEPGRAAASAAGPRRRRRRLAARAAAALPPARGEAGLVGVLRAARKTRRGAARRGRRGDRRARARRAARRGTGSRSSRPFTLPGAAAQLGPGDDVYDPVTERGIDRGARRGAGGRSRSAWAQGAGRHAAAVADPRRAVRRPKQQRAALRRAGALRARRRRGVPARASRCSRRRARLAGHAAGTPLLARTAADGAVASRCGSTAATRDPGAARDGQDVHAARADRPGLMPLGRRVGVTAPSHKAIHNLLEEVERAGREQRLPVPRAQEASSSSEHAYARRSATPG